MKLLIISLAILLPLSVQSQTLTFERLVSVLETEQPNTVASALSALKNYYPAYFENYALVAKSMSIQGATFEAPRVILFDRNADLVVSFNGAADQRGYDRIELMTFNNELKGYDFREIKFMGETKSAGTFEISEAGGVNGRCLTCHGPSALPIWDSSPFWPDYYGAFESSSYQSSPMLSSIQQAELTKYLGFANSIEGHDRYKVLQRHDLQSITNLNARLGQAFGQKIRERAKAQLAVLPQLRAKLSEIFAVFTPTDYLRLSQSGVALPLQPLRGPELEELNSQAEYHAWKLARYADNYGFEQANLLDQLIATNTEAVSLVREATQIAPENKIQLWTYTQVRLADLILVPKLRDTLGDDIRYLNSWSLVPRRRVIDFTHADVHQDESGIEHALADLL